MKCSICNISSDESIIYDGLYGNQIIKVCAKCAEVEEIPLLKKPDSHKLEIADKPLSVRERMEKLSGLNSSRKKTELSSDAATIHKTLNKLRTPPVKEYDDRLDDNYDWELKMARRRKKMTLNQLSFKTGILVEVLEDFEKGKLPKKEEIIEITQKLEHTLGIKILKTHEPAISFVRTIDEEKEILKNVEEKMKHPDEDYEEPPVKFKVPEKQDVIIKKVIKKSTMPNPEKQEKMKMISKGKIDFSKRENLSDITLSDLTEIKKKKDHESMFGNDVELDE